LSPSGLKLRIATWLSVFTGVSLFTVNSMSIKVESTGSILIFSTLPTLGPPAKRTVAPGSSPAALGNFA